MTKEGYQPIKTKKTIKIIPPNTSSNVQKKDGYTWEDLDKAWWEGFDNAKNKMEKRITELEKENTELKKNCEDLKEFYEKEYFEIADKTANERIKELEQYETEITVDDYSPYDENTWGEMHEEMFVPKDLVLDMLKEIYAYIENLKKENTELKGEAVSVLDNWCRGNDPCPHLKKRDDQLTKAKEIIKKIEKIFYNGEEALKRLSKISDIIEEAEQFLKEVEK